MGETEANVETTLNSIYYKIGNPASYSTAQKLYDAVDRKISLNRIREWLSEQLAYTLHKPRRLKFKRGFYNLDNVNIQIQADLMDLASLSDENDGYKYILLVIDSFSRYIRVRPLKSKSAQEVLKAFKQIISELDTPPYQIVTDRGKEFHNSLFGRYAKTIGSNHFSPSSDTFKAALAERAIQSFKHILHKILTATHSLRYIDHISKIAETINGRKNRSINTAPKDVNKNNIYDVWKFVQNQRKKIKFPPARNDVQKGDFVRISKVKDTSFDKGFLPNWTDEIFNIKKTAERVPQIYKLADYKGEEVEGCFYSPEIQKVGVNDETVYRIDKLLGKRTRNGIKEVFVSWKGYSEKDNCWIPEADVVGR